MRILFSCGLFYPSKLGGPANTLFWLAKALVKEGNNVSVVTTDSHIDPGKVITNSWTNVDGIKVRYCGSNMFRLFKMIWHTWKEINDNDTVILCDMFQRQIIPVAFMARMHKKHIIWSPRGELFGPALEGSVVKRWYISFVRKCFSKYATFHATSNEEQEMIYKYIGKDANVVVIPNYIELPQQLERQIPSTPYFLFVGRVNRIKAIDRLILGLAKSELFKQSSYILLIAGPNQNNYQQVLETLIIENNLQEKVKFIGNVFGRDKFQLYANAYFSCLLSHSENFGNVVIEALSQGTPVIASKGTPWQVLNDTNSGYWIDNSSDSIAKCVDQILNLSEQKYKELRFNARKLANSYDVSQNIKNWIDVI